MQAETTEDQNLGIEVLCRFDISVISATPSELNYFVTAVKTGPGCLQCYGWPEIPQNLVMDQLVPQLTSCILQDKKRIEGRRQIMTAGTSKRKLSEDHGSYERDGKRAKDIQVSQNKTGDIITPDDGNQENDHLRIDSKGKKREDSYIASDKDGAINDVSATSSVEEQKDYNRTIRQANRNARKHARKMPPPSMIIPNQDLHGRWMNFPVNTRQEVDLLFNAATILNDEYAFRWVMYVNSHLRSPDVPVGVRTDGAIQILKNYNPKITKHAMFKRMKASLYAFKKRTKKGKKSADAGPSSDRVVTDLYSKASFLASSSSSILPAPHPDLREPSTQQPGDSSMQVENIIPPRPPSFAPPQAMLQYYRVMPVKYWEPYIRVEQRSERLEIWQLPPGTTNAEPYNMDLEASRFLYENIPYCEGNYSATQSIDKFSTMFWCIFSCPGLYRSLIESVGFRCGYRHRENFPFRTDSLNYIQLAVWLSDHNLQPRDPIIVHIEQMAIRVRLKRSGDPFEEGSWPTFPQNAAEAMMRLRPYFVGVSVQFHYPPMVKPELPRTFMFASEAQVYANRAAQRPPLPPIVVLTLPKGVQYR